MKIFTFCTALRKLFIPFVFVGCYLFLPKSFCRETTPDDRFFFIHLPKTGGTTLVQFFADHYHEKDIWNLSVNKSNDPPDSILKSKLFVASHCCLSAIEPSIQENGFHLVTILREPVARVLSASRFAKKFHKHFPQFPEELSPVNVQSNIYCKMLSQLDLNNPLISIEDHLESAKKTLQEKVFFVCLMEKMDASLNLLAKKLGWAPPREILHCNTTESDYQEYPEQIINAVIENNLADIELYKFSLELFEAQKLDVLALSHPENKEPAWSSFIHYTFDQPLLGTGWCLRQNNNLRKSDPTYFRWVVHNEKATLDFPLLPQYNYDLYCKISFSEKSILNLYINNHPIQYSLELKEQEWQLLTAYIPYEFLTPGVMTELTFEIIDPHRSFQLDPYRGRLRCGGISITQHTSKKHNSAKYRARH